MFFIGLVGVLLSWVTGGGIFDLVYTGSFMGYALISLVRKERVMAFGIVFILMALSFVEAWGKMGECKGVLFFGWGTFRIQKGTTTTKKCSKNFLLGIK
ncbi:hypothetical protein ACPJHQ_22855 [Rossellomorea sp. H39__3]